ncbi:phage portal protein [Granulicatella balaenopterae]
MKEHVNSGKIQAMKTAEHYYLNETEIQNKKAPVDADWKTNTKLSMGLFKKFVDQKTGYLFSKAPTITVDGNETAQDFIDDVFDEDTLQVFKDLGRESIIKGVAYAMPYYNEEGRLRLFQVPSEQIIPFWKDERHNELDAFMRMYIQPYYAAGAKRSKIIVEYWDEDGIQEFEFKDNKLIKTNNAPLAHFYYTVEGDNTQQPYVWDKVPLIPFRANKEETSLLVQTKALIDNLELQASTNADILADIPKFIYILRNYDGQDLNEFMRNINLYRSIKVRADGGVDKLQGTTDTTGAEAEIARTRKALYDAARAIDTQDENLGNASGMALKWRYTDLDMDCNDLENEFQKAIQQLLWFVGSYAATIGVDVNLVTFKYQFNRNIISNESEAIENCGKSAGILDDKTVREQHPWYNDDVETRLKEQEKELTADDYAFDHNHEEDELNE